MPDKLGHNRRQLYHGKGHDLHTGAYWLMLALRKAIPATHELAKAEFDPLRIKLLKIGARIIETGSRTRVHFASSCPNASLVRLVAGRLTAASP